MNDENLKPFGKLTESELREIRKKVVLPPAGNGGL